MPNAIETLDDKKLTIGHAALGMHGTSQGTVRQQVHDGDTINVRAIGNFGVRFLGIDTPEISFRLPNDQRFRSIGDPKWDDFLTDPFADKWPPFDKPLPMGLLNYLKAKIGPGTAANHLKHAKSAQEALEGEIFADIKALGQTEESFRFFLAFAHEIMDGYGRFLCYVNREQPSATMPAPRPLTYNERMLEKGLACSLFIWPNINPFRRADSVRDAVPAPGTARQVADADSTLRRARDWGRQARMQHAGIFQAMDPLRLEAFELRFLARRSLPGRWVIDLTRNDDILLQPQNYYSIPRAEDRLFIPSEYVPLFVEKGWKREA